MPAFSCSSRHFTHFAIYRIIFGVGNFSRGFFVCSERKCLIFVSVYFVFICCYKLNSPHNEMRTGPGLFSLGAFPTFRTHDFSHDACMLNPVREGERIEAIRYCRRLKIFANFLFFFFFSFCRSVVGTSGLAPSPTSGGLFLSVLGKI